MNAGKIVFAQLIAHLPMHRFRRLVKKYRGDYKVRSFSCMDQFLTMIFAQLTFRESLRDIEATLRAMKPKLYHMGIRSNISRTTLAEANEKRDWRIYAEFAQHLIVIARDLHREDHFIADLEETVYALDSTTIDLCLSLFNWARFRQTKAAVKLHTLLDLRGSIPVFIRVTDGATHDVNILDILIPDPGAFYVMDRGYIDFKRLYDLNEHKAFFVIRAKANLAFRRIRSNPVDKSEDLICDQIIRLTVEDSRKDYPEKLRRVKFYDKEHDNRIVVLTNNFKLPALTIKELYKHRWQVELFFKWIKQNLRIKSFYGTSINAVKTQIWTAISTYLMVAIIRKRLNLELSLYTFLQILSVSAFEKVEILQLLSETQNTNSDNHSQNQLNLFDL